MTSTVKKLIKRVDNVVQHYHVGGGTMSKNRQVTDKKKDKEEIRVPVYWTIVNGKKVYDTEEMMADFEMKLQAYE